MAKGKFDKTGEHPTFHNWELEAFEALQEQAVNWFTKTIIKRMCMEGLGYAKGYPCEAFLPLSLEQARKAPLRIKVCLPIGEFPDDPPTWDFSFKDIIGLDNVDDRDLDEWKRLTLIRDALQKEVDALTKYIKKKGA